MREYYIYPTLEAANAAIAAIGTFLPTYAIHKNDIVIHTTKWVEEARLMLSGEYAIPRISEKKLDHAGPIIEVEGVLKHTGLSEEVRLGFMAIHGQKLRMLTAADFPVIEEEVP